MKTVMDWLDNPKKSLVDLGEAQDIEVVVDHQGKLWVNVDGVCVLRIGELLLKVYVDVPQNKLERRSR